MKIFQGTNPTLTNPNSWQAMAQATASAIANGIKFDGLDLSASHAARLDLLIKPTKPQPFHHLLTSKNGESQKLRIHTDGSTTRPQNRFEYNLSDSSTNANRSPNSNPPIPIAIDFEIPKNRSLITKEMIHQILKAIVEQDVECYPASDARLMSTGDKYYVKRKYLIGGKTIRLSTIAGWTRMSKGMASSDIKALPGAAIVSEWKKEVFGLEDKPNYDLEIQIGFELPQIGIAENEEQIHQILRAIVAEDSDLYPEGDASPMATTRKYYVDRTYLIGSRTIRLNTLVRWTRQLRGFKPDATAKLSNGKILQEWKRDVFGIEAHDLEINTRVKLPATGIAQTEEQIHEILRAIVSQDSHLYPDGDASLMSSSKIFFGKRKYLISGRIITLNMLASWVRQLRGYRSYDRSKLSRLQILREWKKDVFGLDDEPQYNLEIQIGFEMPKTGIVQKEEQIHEILRAIVTQDSELYPQGDAGSMSTSRKYFLDRIYLIGGRLIRLSLLVGWVRLLRNLRVNDTLNLKTSQIIKEWKKSVFGLGSNFELEIHIGFEIPKNGIVQNEDQIHDILRAIVEQDSELYPTGNASQISTSLKYLNRSYLIGNTIIRLSTLVSWTRRLRGLRSDDSLTLPHSQIFAEWKAALGVIDFKSISQSDLDEFIKNNNISDLINIFEDDPQLLIQALNFLKPNTFKNKDVTEFVKAYVGLTVNRGPKSEGTTKQPSPWEKKRAYIQAIIKAIEYGEQLDISEERFKEQLNLIIRLSRISFAEDAQKLITELETDALTMPNDFLRRIHSKAADYFRSVLDFELAGMQTPAYSYQKEGIQFLASRDSAILADEAGLGKTYQVIAAAETLKLKRVLWITTATNKDQVQDEIVQHANATSEDVKIVISGDPKSRSQQLEDLNGERYIITNYETLVALKKSDPKGYAKLTADLDVIVVDEAQLTDNQNALRTKAIKEIKSKRRWLLSASPYQSKPERIWTLLNYLKPDQYPDYKAFKEMYTKSTSGLILLHSELTEIMLRRTKADTMGFFVSPEEISFEEQLKGEIPRVPRKVRIVPEQSGSCELTLEQQDLIAWMTADFRDWATYFNANLPDHAEPIEIDNINSLQKFGMIHRVIFEPEYFGLDIENPILKTVDQMVAQKLARGEKVILWGWNTHMIDTFVKRYARFGVRRIDGKVVGDARKNAKLEFQNDADTRILVANYKSGGVGLTLTAAHHAIFLQLPDHFPSFYQAEGRNQRLIGPKNIQHAKEMVTVSCVVPRFSQEFIDSLEDKQLQDILSKGTLVQQTYSRIMGGEILYNLVLEGYGSIDDLEEHFKSGVIRAMGLTNDEKLDFTSHLKGKIKSLAKIVQSLLPLWHLVQGNQEAEDKVITLIEALRHYPKVAKKLGEAFRESATYEPDDLDYINTLFDIKNKYIREQVLAKMPDLLIKLYPQGKTLTQTAKKLNLGRLSPTTFVAQIYIESGADKDLILPIVKELGSQRQTPHTRYLLEHFFMGIFGTMGSPEAESLLKDKLDLFSQANLIEQVHKIYQIGLLTRIRPDLISDLNDKSYNTWHQFSEDIAQATHIAIADFADRSVEKVADMIQNNHNWRGNADPLLALIAGYDSFGNETLLDQAKETIGHILDDYLKTWRYGDNNRNFGKNIDYLDDDPAFWDGYAIDHQTTFDEVTISEQMANKTLLRNYISLIQEFDQDGDAVEGTWVKENIDYYRSLKTSKGDLETRDTILGNYVRDLQLLGGILGDHELTDATRDILTKYNLTYEDSLNFKSNLKQKLQELKNLVSWMILDNGFRDVNKGQNPNWQRLIRTLDLKAKFYRQHKQDKMADHIDTLKDTLIARATGGISYSNITIQDTDDPAIIARMGALHPDMINCFNPNGNPTFNQFVITALASKNMKLTVVKAKLKKDGPEEIVAIAMTKLKKLEDGTPVLFLERGLFRKGYDFREEMLTHLKKKAEAMQTDLDFDIQIMDEVRGRPKDRDVIVYGTGAYTNDEYVESVFGLRRAENVRHYGRFANIQEPSQTAGTSNQDLAPLTGIGMSNKSWQEYVDELKDKGVKVVIDVRERPYMRSSFLKHFNRNRMNEALEAEGIEYIWLGQTLGNPKIDGQRNLHRFQSDHMQTKAYESGVRRLQTILRQAQGTVALTCVERHEKDCHRHMILDDIRERLGIEPSDPDDKNKQISLFSDNN